MPTPVENVWQRIYGKQFGYNPEYMRVREETFGRQADVDYQQGVKAGTANLSGRGFYSARPVASMIGGLNTQRMRAMRDFRMGLQTESEQLAQQQKGQLFQAQTQEELAEQTRAFELVRMAKKHGYDIKKMELQDKMTLHQMAVNHGYQKTLIEFEHDLNKPGFMDVLGNMIGIGGGMILGGLNYGKIGSGLLKGAGWLYGQIADGGNSPRGPE